MTFLNYSYFAKITTRKPKIDNLTNTTKLYPFLESKKWYLLFKGILRSCDLLVKTINSVVVVPRYSLQQRVRLLVSSWARVPEQSVLEQEVQLGSNNISLPSQL